MEAALKVALLLSPSSSLTDYPSFSGLPSQLCHQEEKVYIPLPSVQQRLGHLGEVFPRLGGLFPSPELPGPPRERNLLRAQPAEKGCLELPQPWVIVWEAGV